MFYPWLLVNTRSRNLAHNMLGAQTSKKILFSFRQKDQLERLFVVYYWYMLRTRHLEVSYEMKVRCMIDWVERTELIFAMFHKFSLQSFCRVILSEFFFAFIYVWKITNTLNSDLDFKSMGLIIIFIKDVNKNWNLYILYIFYF